MPISIALSAPRAPQRLNSAEVLGRSAGRPGASTRERLRSVLVTPTGYALGGLRRTAALDFGSATPIVFASNSRSRGLIPRRSGHVYAHGWHVGYIWGADDQGEYLEFLAQHRMTDDSHVRLYAAGRVQESTRPAARPSCPKKQVKLSANGCVAKTPSTTADSTARCAAAVRYPRVGQILALTK